MDEVKALSVRQPYAWLIVAGFKPVENRTWSTRYRGPLAIHAATKPHVHKIDEIAERHGVRVNPDALRYGGIIGVVDLVDVVTHHPSHWFTGPFGWVFERPRPRRFYSIPGKQSLFNAPLR